MTYLFDDFILEDSGIIQNLDFIECSKKIFIFNPDTFVRSVEKFFGIFHGTKIIKRNVDLAIFLEFDLGNTAFELLLGFSIWNLVIRGLCDIV